MNETTDKDYLIIKVAAIMGNTGGCKTAELVDMQIGHIEDRASLLVVNIPDRNIQLCRMYKDLRPKNVPHNKFFYVL